MPMQYFVFMQGLNLPKYRMPHLSHMAAQLGCLGLSSGRRQWPAPTWHCRFDSDQKGTAGIHRSWSTSHSWNPDNCCDISSLRLINIITCSAFQPIFNLKKLNKTLYTLWPLHINWNPTRNWTYRPDSMLNSTFTDHNLCERGRWYSTQEEGMIH